MDYQRKQRRPIPAPPEKEFLTDPEAAFVVGCGLTKLAALEKTDPGFPRPVWLGPRGKRHVRSELREYVLRKRERLASMSAAPFTSRSPRHPTGGRDAEI